MSDSNTNPASRFASSGHTAEDLLKEQTVGLVHLSDFRKRRAEALEQSGGSGASTPTGGESRYVHVKKPDLWKLSQEQKTQHIYKRQTFELEAVVQTKIEISTER